MLRSHGPNAVVVQRRCAYTAPSADDRLNRTARPSVLTKACLPALGINGLSRIMQNMQHSALFTDPALLEIFKRTCRDLLCEESLLFLLAVLDLQVRIRWLEAGRW